MRNRSPTQFTVKEGPITGFFPIVKETVRPRCSRTTELFNSQACVLLHRMRRASAGFGIKQ